MSTENTEDKNTPDPGSTSPPEIPKSEAGDPPQGITGIVEALLRRPGELATHLRGESRGRIILLLLAATIGCLLIFGFVVGTFSMGTQLWAAPLKIALGVLASGLLCLPSLYIFSCLSGSNAKLPEVGGMLAGTLCLIALLLIGFAPVVWVFGQSTESVGFIGALDLIIWLIALCFGMNFVFKASKRLGARNTAHLLIWVAVFALVTFQMTASLRPIVGTSDKIFTTEKKFFLQHWGETLSGQNSSRIYKGE